MEESGGKLMNSLGKAEAEGQARMASMQAALSAALPANMMKLVTAVLFLLVLVLSGRKGEEIIHA